MDIASAIDLEVNRVAPCFTFTRKGEEDVLEDMSTNRHKAGLLVQNLDKPSSKVEICTIETSAHDDSHAAENASTEGAQGSILSIVEDGVPIDLNVNAVLRFLDAVKYKDNSYPNPEDRLQALKEVWSKAAEHFELQLQQKNLDVSLKKLHGAMRTGVSIVVYSWSKLPRPAMVDLAIYFAYCTLFDDSNANAYRPEAHMDTFASGLLTGKQQEHPFWRLMNAHLSKFLEHYGPFCQLAIYRSTLDWYQGTWVESRNFLGYPGADCYPISVRRLTSLGQTSAASFFSKYDFIDEKEHIEVIATMLAQFEPFFYLWNDLISFYKEANDDSDQVFLVRMYCGAEGMTMRQAFDRLTDDTIRSLERLRRIFIENQPSPRLAEMLDAYIQGYVTWHFCDVRYRLHEVYDQVGETPDGLRFRQYFDQMMSTGWIDWHEWAIPLDVADEVKGKYAHL